MPIRRRIVRQKPARTGVAIRAQRKKPGNWLADPRRLMAAVFVISLVVLVLALAMGAVSHWTADNTLVTKAGTNKARIYGNIQYVSGRSGQENDKAWSFDGKGSAVAIPDSSTLYNARTMTMSGWIKLDASGNNSGWQAVYNKREGGKYEHRLWVNKSGYLMAFLGTSTGNIGVITKGGAVKTGQWVHYAVVANTSTGKLQIWVNGQQAANTSFATKKRVFVGYTNTNGQRVARYVTRATLINNTRGPWVLGAYGTSSTYIKFYRFIGAVDEFRIDTTALDATMIKALAGIAVAATATPVPTATATPAPSAAPTPTPTLTPATAAAAPTPTPTPAAGSTKKEIEDVKKEIDDLLKEMGERVEGD